jgi:hypothetical protein
VKGWWLLAELVKQLRQCTTDLELLNTAESTVDIVSMWSLGSCLWRETLFMGFSYGILYVTTHFIRVVRHVQIHTQINRNIPSEAGTRHWNRRKSCIYPCRWRS